MGFPKFTCYAPPHNYKLGDFSKDSQTINLSKKYAVFLGILKKNPKP